MIAAVARALVLVAAICLLPAHASQVIVVRRGWHIDVGFALDDLRPPLRRVATDLPNARFILFGFGDLHYLMTNKHGSSSLAAALWPGQGVLLVTGLENTPEQGFGAAHVVRLELDSIEVGALQDAIWSSFERPQGSVTIYKPGPYDDGLYYLSTRRYSAAHTCNTWAAEVLSAGGLKVRPRTTWFAAQLWSQVRRLHEAPHPAPSLAPSD